MENHGQTKRGFVLISVMLAMFMAAIEGTIIATAMPSIVAELGGFSLFSWVFSVFLLAQAVTIPIYGKLADVYGRKPVFTFGVLIFLIGSILCGLAQNMQSLILFRLIQGLGAGAVQPTATTIVGDIFTITERAKIQGYISSVWGFSSIIGPALGAFFVQYVHWAWVFWMNIPIGIFAVLGIWFFLSENVERRVHQIDYLGSGLIFISISVLMIVFIQAGTVWSWMSPQVLSLLGLFVFGLILFIFQERRAPEPIIKLELWKDRMILVSNLATLTTGIIIIGITSFMPTYVQGVIHQTPLIAGFTLAFMSIGWPIAATFAGRLMLNYGFKKVALAGGVWITLGTFFLVSITVERGWIWGALGAFFIGIGMGLARTVFIVAIQNSVGWEDRGVATASNMFMNILGNTVGAALLGGILNMRLLSFLKTLPSSPYRLNVDVVNVLLDPSKRSQFPQELIHQITTGLSIALKSVYWGVFIFGIASLVFITLLPKHEVEKD